VKHKPPKTFYQASREFNEAITALGQAIAQEWHLRQIVEWLTRQLNKIGETKK